MAKLTKHDSLCNFTFVHRGVFSQLFSPIDCFNTSFLLSRSVTPCESQESLELLYVLVKCWVCRHFHGQKLYFWLFLWGSQEEATYQITFFCDLPRLCKSKQKILPQNIKPNWKSTPQKQTNRKPYFPIQQFCKTRICKYFFSWSLFSIKGIFLRGKLPKVTKIFLPPSEGDLFYS